MSRRAALAAAAVVVLAGSGGAAWLVRPVPARGPVAVPDPQGGPDRLLLDSVRPTGPVRLLWLDGRTAQPAGDDALVLDGAGGVLRVDAHLSVRRLPLLLEGREVASAAPASGGGWWLTDAAGSLLRANAAGEVLEAPRTVFAYPAVVADAEGAGAWLVRSPERFAYTLPPSGAPLLLRLDPAGGPPARVGTARRPAHALLADLANAGRLAVGRGAVYYAPFIRDEVIALTPSGEILWVARRGLPQSTADPRFELHDGRVVIDYHPVNLGLALGPDGLLYVLSTAGPDMMRGRLDVLDPATGRVVRTASLATPLPTLAADSNGRVYRLSGAGLLAGVMPPRREPAPALDLPLLEGGRLTSAALRGRVVLINLWASWCVPCRREMPALDSLRREVGDTFFVFLGINEEADTAAARAFLRRFDFDFPVPLGRGRLRPAFHYPGLPYTLLVDRDGRIVRRWIGFAGPDQVRSIRALIRAELGPGAPHPAAH